MNTKNIVSKVLSFVTMFMLVFTIGSFANYVKAVAPFSPAPSPSLVCTPNSPQTIVSDSGTQVGSGNAVAVTPHSAWAAASIPEATWIWDVDKTPANDSGSNAPGTLTFTRTFTIAGTPTGATLNITTDNSYVVTINSNAVGSNGTWQDIETYSIPASSLSSGTNTLTIVATNDAPEGDGGNPAGLLYKLVVDSETCAPTTGSIDITKYICPIGTTVIRSVNGVEGIVPDDCVLDEGPTFGYVHGEAPNTDGPYPELAIAAGGGMTEGGSTNSSGVLTMSGLAATGRYLIAETNGSGTQLPSSEIINLYC